MMGSKAGFNSQPVEHPTIRPGHAVPDSAALPVDSVFGCVEQTPQFVVTQGSAVMPTISPGVPPLKVCQRVFRCPTIADHPMAELLHGLKVEIGGLNAHAVLAFA